MMNNVFHEIFIDFLEQFSNILWFLSIYFYFGCLVKFSMYPSFYTIYLKMSTQNIKLPFLAN